MTVTDLDQLEHEHPALLAMHQRMKEEAVTLSARVADLKAKLAEAERERDNALVRAADDANENSATIAKLTAERDRFVRMADRAQRNAETAVAEIARLREERDHWKQARESAMAAGEVLRTENARLREAYGGRTRGDLW